MLSDLADNMDIVAHGAWAAVGLAWVHQRWPVPRRIAITTVAMAVLPDLLHLAPAAAWALLDDGSWTALRDYAVALPGQEPVTTPLVASLTNHLHCVMHSAVVAAVASALAWRVWRGLRLWYVPLLGWWSHIVIDVFSHSADFYPSPVLYPFTQRGFDGLAWNTPWFMALNYASLTLSAVWLLVGRKQR